LSHFREPCSILSFAAAGPHLRTASWSRHDANLYYLRHILDSPGGLVEFQHDRDSRWWWRWRYAKFQQFFGFWRRWWCYSKISNISGLSGTLTIQVGAGGAPGVSGGDTWFNGPTLGASSVGAKGGGAGDVNMVVLGVLL